MPEIGVTEIIAIAHAETVVKMKATPKASTSEMIDKVIALGMSARTIVAEVNPDADGRYERQHQQAGVADVLVGAIDAVGVVRTLE